MVTMANVWTYVEAPPVIPHPYGLFSVAPPVSPADTHWTVGVQWQSVGCADINTKVDPCVNGTAMAPLIVDPCPTVVGFKPVTLYVYAKRSGLSDEVARAQGEASFAGAEERGAEAFLWQEALAQAGTLNTAEAPIRALGVVEQALANQYNGTGVIHMSRFVATLISDHLMVKGNQLTTLLGTPVVAGGGYDNQLTPQHTEATILGTGAVAVRRGPIDTYPAVDRTVNDLLILAERTYVIGWDCVVVGRKASI